MWRGSIAIVEEARRSWWCNTRARGVQSSSVQWRHEMLSSIGLLKSVRVAIIGRADGLLWVGVETSDGRVGDMYGTYGIGDRDPRT
jgi:hypothetical protein